MLVPTQKNKNTESMLRAEFESAIPMFQPPKTVQPLWLVSNP